jgi:hypothetical protein
MVRRAALATTSFLVALYAASPWLVQKALPPLLARWGIEDAHVSVGYPTWSGLDVAAFGVRIGDVDVDGGATRIDWSLPRLVRGELESIAVAELTVRVARATTASSGAVELPPFWALIPARRVAVQRLIVANDDPRIDGVGSVTFDPEVLQANLRVESPLLAVPLDVVGSVDPGGHLSIEIAERDVAEPFAAVTGTIDRGVGALVFDGHGTLSGRPLELFAAYAGVRSIAGSLQWQAAGRTPWPLPAEAASGVDATVRYRVDLADAVTAAGTARVRLEGEAQIANGRMKARIADGAFASFDSPLLADVARRAGVGTQLSVAAEQGVVVELAERRFSVGDGFTLALSAPDKPILLRIRGALGLDGSFDVGVVGLDGSPVLLATGAPDGERIALKGQLVLNGRPLHAAAAAAGIVSTDGHVAVDFEGRLGAAADAPYGFDGRGRVRFALTGKAGDAVVDAKFDGDYAVGTGIDTTVDAGAHFAVTSSGADVSTVGPIRIAVRTAPLSVDVGPIDCRVALAPIHVGKRSVTLTNAWVSIDAVKVAGNSLTGGATLRTHAGRDAWPLRLTLSHDLAAGTGSFGLGGEWHAQKGALNAQLPGFDAPYDVDDGSIALHIDGGWNVGKTVTYSAKGRLGVKAQRAHYDDFAITGLVADLPLSIDDDGLAVGANVVTIDSVDVGFPVTNVAVDFDVADGNAHVRELSGATLGGRFSAKSFDYDLALDKTALWLDLTDLSLARVLELEGGDVHGDGVLDGKLPIELDGSTLTIADGRVLARPPGGTLVYKGAAAASFAAKSGLGFALQALEDFRFRTLDAKVGLAPDGVLALGVRLQGMNPAVEQGRAIQFNLNVTESLPALLESLRAADRITERVERKLVP